MKKEELDAHIGQALADSTFVQAMLISLMELLPDLDARILSKVAAMDLAQRQNVADQYLKPYRVRLKELQAFVLDARLPPDGTTPSGSGM